MDFAAELTNRRTIVCLFESAIHNYCDWLRWGNVVTDPRQLTDDFIDLEDGLNLTHAAGNNKAAAHGLAFKSGKLCGFIGFDHLDGCLLESLFSEVNDDGKGKNYGDENYRTKF